MALQYAINAGNSATQLPVAKVEPNRGFSQTRTGKRLVDALEQVDWEAPQATLWGDKPLKMIVTKTYQHTFEHGDTLLRMGLWWE
jgi:hypothetical protein